MSAPFGAKDDGLPLAVKERIDQVCLDFEDRCRAGENPRLEEYLVEYHNQEREALLAELLKLDVGYRRQRGEAPALNDYLQRFPDDRPLLRECLPESEPEPVCLEPGDCIGHYVIEHRVGIGAFASVYRARDPATGSVVALKIPRPSALRSPDSAERLAEEARTLSTLHHPAIVACHDVIQDQQGVPVIVMEYVEGGSLRELIEDRSFSHAEIAELVATVADAMDYAHRAGFVHRDLEPRNILIDARRRPHVSDFGLAIHESVQRKRYGETAGSMAYMSPEQVRGESQWLDGRADIWGIGAILYELLTHRRPFSGRTMDEVANEILWREPKPPRQIQQDISPELERICLKCLSKSITDRYTTAGDLADELRVVIRREFSRPARRFPKLSRRGWLWVFVGLLSAAVIATSTWLRFFVTGQFTTPATLTGSLDVRVAKPTTTGAGQPNVSVSQPSSLPLVPDDEVQMLVRLNRPSYVHVILIETSGRVSTVFPAPSPEGYLHRRSSQSKVVALSLPSDGSWIVTDGPTGIQTVVLLASDAPLPSLVDMPQLLVDLEPQIGEAQPEALWLSNRRKISSLDDDTETMSPVVAAMRRNHDRVVQKLGVYFDVIESVAIPFQGRKEQATSPANPR